MKVKPFNDTLKRLKTIINTEANYSESIDLALKLHSMVHLSEVSRSNSITYEDQLWDGLDDVIAKTALTRILHEIL